jgi:hypothetical protein
MFQAGERPQQLSQPASVQLSAVAKLLRLNVTIIQEATLFGERALVESDNKRPEYNYSQVLTKWKPPLVLPAAELSFTSNRLVGSIPVDARVTLQPMQIRAFFFTMQRSQGSNCTDPPQPSGKPIAAGSWPTAADHTTAAGSVAAAVGGTTASSAADAENSLLLGLEQQVKQPADDERASGAAPAAPAASGREVELQRAAAVQQSHPVNVSSTLLSIRIKPTVARAALLSRGVLLLFLLVPTSVAFGIATCLLGRGSLGRQKSVSPKHIKLKGVI